MKARASPHRWVAEEDLVEQRKRMRHTHDCERLPCGCKSKSDKSEEGEGRSRRTSLAGSLTGGSPEASASPRQRTPSAEGAEPLPESQVEDVSASTRGWCSYTLGTRVSGEHHVGGAVRDMVFDALKAHGFSVISQADLTDTRGHKYTVIGANIPEVSQRAMLLDPCASTMLSVSNIVVRRVARVEPETCDSTEVLIMDPTLALRISCHRAMPLLALEYRTRLLAVIQSLDRAES